MAASQSLSRTTHPATPTRLKDGSWGALVAAECVSEGDVVTITTRGGKSWEARIDRVVWSGIGKFGPTKGQPVSIVATVSLEASRPSRHPLGPRSYARTRGWTPCGYPGCSPSYCDECDGEGYRGWGR